jgi:hypothetical protein
MSDGTQRCSCGLLSTEKRAERWQDEVCGQSWVAASVLHCGNRASSLSSARPFAADLDRFCRRVGGNEVCVCDERLRVAAAAQACASGFSCVCVGIGDQIAVSSVCTQLQQDCLLCNESVDYVHVFEFALHAPRLMQRRHATTSVLSNSTV